MKKILALMMAFLICFTVSSSVNASISISSEPKQSTNDLGKLIYDVNGVKVYKKIKARYYTDPNGVRHDLPLDYEMDKLIRNPIVPSNDNTQILLDTSKYRGEAIQIAGLNNKSGADEATLTYNRSHTYKCERSVSGKVSWKVVEEKAGVKREDSYTEEIDVALKIPAGQAINLWLAPEGTTYNFNIYKPGPPIEVIGWGTWTNITKLQITPVSY